jgi:hypothetical protein
MGLPTTILAYRLKISFVAKSISIIPGEPSASLFDARVRRNVLLYLKRLYGSIIMTPAIGC